MDSTGDLVAQREIPWAIESGSYLYQMLYVSSLMLACLLACLLLHISPCLTSHHFLCIYDYSGVALRYIQCICRKAVYGMGSECIVSLVSL